MRAVVQRVLEAELKVNGSTVSKIGKGLVVFLGISEEDTNKHIPWLANKISGLRIFDDSEDKLNLSVKDIDGEILVVSNFTLYGNCVKGFRPSFIKAMRPEMANLLYEEFLFEINNHYPNKIKRGIFGADMKISQINDGPITIFIDTKDIEK